MEKKDWIILALLIFIFGIVSSIMINSYNTNQIKMRATAYTNGTQVGAENALSYVFNTVKDCKTLPISYGNETATIVSYECVQKYLQQKE